MANNFFIFSWETKERYGEKANHEYALDVLLLVVKRLDGHQQEEADGAQEDDGDQLLEAHDVLCVGLLSLDGSRVVAPQVALDR